MSLARTDSFKSAQDLPEPVSEALAATLLSLADNKRILGMRYGEWILGAPTLESGIACSAMAQDEWGHARILYATLKDFGFEPGVLEHDRPAGEYLSSELLDIFTSSQGVILRHREFGYVANGMCAWQVAAEGVDEAGRRLAGRPDHRIGPALTAIGDREC